MYVSENGVSINYSLARSFYNDHRSTTAFNSFLGSWSVFSLASQAERTIGSHDDRLRLARANLPEIRSGNRTETPSVRHERGKSWRRTPEGMFVRLAAITGYPRRLYSIVYIDVDSSFHVPVFLAAKGEAPMTSFHLRVLRRKNDVLSSTPSSYFLFQPESRSRISGRVISIAQSPVNYTSTRYNV